MKEVYIVGIGMGSLKGITLEGLEIIKNSDFIIGAERMINSFKNIFGAERKNKEKDVETCTAISSDKIFEAIMINENAERIAVLMSGDTGFFSGTKKLAEKLKIENIEYKIVAGISSPIYLASKIAKSWDTWKIISLHGRDNSPLNYILNNEETFFLLDKINTPDEICRQLCEVELGEIPVYIGERLSYDDEKISIGRAKDFVDERFDSLSVILVENISLSNKDRIVTHGIDDEEFIRGNVPMTKEEVRIISISKLEPREDDIVYDVGAGTGSVAIEIAKQVKYGCVYAIESNQEGVKLIEENKKKFKTYNLEAVHGMAPEVMEELPPPDRVFIGGSKGNMEVIVESILKKNSDAKIVVNAIALETLGEVLRVFKHFKFNHVDIVQLSSARTKKVGPYNMLMGMNPIFIVTGQKNKRD